MIPLKNSIPSRRYPFITVIIIAINIIVFFYELRLGPSLESFMYRVGLIPHRYFNPSLYGGTYPNCYLSIFYSLFLHGGWIHLIGNMLYLWIFGDNVEDRLGHLGFLLFYLLCGFGASFAHILFNPHSFIPTIGASGAIAGVLGAYFILFPKSKIITLLPIFIFLQIVEVPAYFFLGFWFLIQFFSGVLSLKAGLSGGIGWWAHIGGFVIGMLLLPLFLRRKKRNFKWQLH